MWKTTQESCRLSIASLGISLLLSGGQTPARADLQVVSPLERQELPNMGQQITPLTPGGARFVGLDPELPGFPGWLAGQAVTTVVSPDKKTLLVLTSGFNRLFSPNDKGQPAVNPAASTEHVFVFDISTAEPVKKQILRVPTAYNGLAFDPSGEAFYVSGGSDDNVHVFVRSASGIWGKHPVQGVIALGHRTGVGIPPLDVPDQDPDDPIAKVNSLIVVKPCAAGLAISSDGRMMVVANYYNDSITILWGGLGAWNVWKELDLRPGKSDRSLKGTPGGTYPFWVAIAGSGPYARAYVSSIRDREVVVAGIGVVPKIMDRIKVKGQPIKMTLNKAQTRLYVVEDQSDTVDVIDTGADRIVETIPLIASSPALPAALARLTGANPNSATLSPDEKELWVTAGNLNCVAVLTLGGPGSPSGVAGLIPTGWYPNSVSFGAEGLAPDGRSYMAYVVNGKSPTGPNPGFCYSYGPPEHTNCYLANQYNPQLIKAGFQSFPIPRPEQMPALTAQVAVNNRLSSTVSAADADVLAAVRRGVKHVVFVVKENRTYDQVLGDLEVGNGEPSLAEFGARITPNQHEMARRFVTLDSFYCSAETSNDGWPWTTSARAPDVIERQFPSMYAARGLSLDSEGTNRSVNVSLATVAERRDANPLTSADPDVLAGQANVAAPDGPDNEVNTGYLWDAALRANLSVRNYGFFLDLTRYSLVPGSPYYIPLERRPFEAGLVVAYPSSVSLAPHTDRYFRGFDPSYPDYHRFREWERDFDALYGGAPDGMAPANDLPSLTLVRFMNDHTGSFLTAIDGVNTPELQVADNDYALGLLVEKISKSRHANDTLIFVIEDDAQDGGDHVDSHRSPAFVIGAWVKRGVVVSSQHNTIDFLRTIEEILGIPPMNLNDALARPMAEVFETAPRPWSFTAAPAPILYGTDLEGVLPPRPAGLEIPKPTRDSKYWAEATKGMDFSSEDRFDFARYNRILWKGLMGDRPYPDKPTGLDLRSNRKELLDRFRAAATLGAPKEM